MNSGYLYQTTYFNQPWTWIKRVVEALIVVVAVYWIDLREIEVGSGLLLIGYVFAGALAIYMLSRPIDALAFDKEKLYYIQRSFIPFFNRSKAYKISEIRRIKSTAAFTPILPMYGLMPSEFVRSKIEITSKDGLSERRSFTINKKELDKIVTEVNAMVH